MVGTGRPPESIRHRAYEHACRVYAELEKRSVPAAGVTHDGKPYRLFRGSLQQLCMDLGYASTSQYSAIRDDLQAMRCIELERRGVRGVPGIWRLLRAPTVGLWEHYLPDRKFSRRVEADHREGHARALRAALERLPSTRPDVAAALRDAGITTFLGAVTWLARNLPETSLRALGPSMCLAYATEGTPVATPHTCAVEGLDDLTPSKAAGAWKRRQDALTRLGEVS
jgi:hypothetical protein